MSAGRAHARLGPLVWASVVLLPAAALVLRHPAAGAAMLAAAGAVNVVLWRVNERERSQTASALRRLQVQYDVTATLAGSATLDDAAPKLLRLIGRRLGFTAGVLWTPDAGGEVLRPTRTWVADQASEPIMRRFQEEAAYVRGQGLAGRAWAAAAPAVATAADATRPVADPAQAAAHAAGLRGMVALPVLHAGEVLGVIAFTRATVTAVDPETVELLESLTRQLAIFMDRLARVQEAADYQDAALRDALTGLLNRRAWEERLPALVARAGRHGEPLCFAVLDLDRFKAYNDAHGHQAGDDVLRAAASSWRAAIRTEDVLARYGGEEFVLAMPACDLASAEELVERLRQRLPHRITCSIGLAAWEPHETAAEAIGRADRALYAAKGAGRDRIFLAPRTAATEAVEPSPGAGADVAALTSAPSDAPRPLE